MDRKVTKSEFARMANVSAAAIGKAIKTGRLDVIGEGRKAKINPDSYKSVQYLKALDIQRTSQGSPIVIKNKLKHPQVKPEIKKISPVLVKQSKDPAPAKKQEKEESKLIFKKNNIKFGLKDIEIFLRSLSRAFEQSSIPTKEKQKIKNNMIDFAEEIEREQILNNYIIPDDKKSYNKKIITATRIIKRFAGDLIPKKEENIFFITTAQLNATAFLLYVTEELGIIEELIMSYFRISYKSAEIIKKLIETDKIKKSYIMLSELSTRDAKSADETFESLCLKYPEKIAGGLSQTHTKIMCFKIKDNFYTLSGSANITGNNARIEQYSIINDKVLYDFNKKWILNPETILKQKDSVFFGNKDIFE